MPLAIIFCNSLSFKSVSRTRYQLRANSETILRRTHVCLLYTPKVSLMRYTINRGENCASATHDCAVQKISIKFSAIRLFNLPHALRYSKFMGTGQAIGKQLGSCWGQWRVACFQASSRVCNELSAYTQFPALSEFSRRAQDFPPLLL